PDRPSVPHPLPYTTLFRSDPAAERAVVLAEAVGDANAGADAQPAIQQHQHIHRLEAMSDHRVVAFAPAMLVERPQGAQAQAADRDRKSTRLNSSHVKISYA